MPIMGIAMQIVTNLLTQIPLLAVWVIGAILSVVFWQRDSRGALLILLASLICLFDVIAFGVLYAVLPQFFHSGMNLGGISIQMIYSAIGFVRSCLMAIAWILVLVAVFRRRPAA